MRRIQDPDPTGKDLSQPVLSSLTSPVKKREWNSLSQIEHLIIKRTTPGRHLEYVDPGYGAMRDAGISPAVGIAGHGGIPGMPALPSPTAAYKYQVGLNFSVIVVGKRS